MSGPKRHAPPPACWPGGKPPSGAAAPAGAVQPQASFGALRAAKAVRGGPGDELMPAPGDGFLLKTAARGLHVKPDGTYNFVRVNGGKPNDAHTLVSPRSNHAGLADGRPVLYAGTARFESGRLEWWSNYSGTYQPAAAFRQQAGLPDDRFVPWQRLAMGGVGLQRTMLGERRASTRPEASQPGAPKPEAAKPAAPKAEGGKVEGAKSQTPRPEAPKPEAARPEPSRPQAAPVQKSGAPPAR